MSEMITLKPLPAKRGSVLYENEQPIKVIHLSPFMIDKFPVTNLEFAEFVNAEGYSQPKFWFEAGYRFIKQYKIQQPLYWNDSSFNGSNQPVTGISWWEAMAFAKFLGKELPTEAQWEYAAGLGKNKYPWGQAKPNSTYANFAPGCEPVELNRRTENVDFFPKGVAASGCWDMAGNVGEWCLDNYSSNYSWDKASVDPVYKTHESDQHIVRGGSGLHDEDCLRCSSRDYYPPNMRDNIVGMRCVRRLQSCPTKN